MEGGLRSEQGQSLRFGTGNWRLAVLWCLAILIFGVGDLLTSSFAFALGAVEGNPIVQSMIGINGDNVWLLTILKSALLSILLLLSYLQMGKYAWTIPAVLTCAGVYMLLHNLAVLTVLLQKA